MITSFKNELAKTIFNGEPLSRKQAKEFPANLYKKARIKLDILNQAACLEDLYFPPSNRFEALSGDRQGQYSIRIQGSPWRVVFKWDGNAQEVETIDYH